MTQMAGGHRTANSRRASRRDRSPRLQLVTYPCSSVFIRVHLCSSAALVVFLFALGLLRKRCLATDEHGYKAEGCEETFFRLAYIIKRHCAEIPAVRQPA